MHDNSSRPMKIKTKLTIILSEGDKCKQRQAAALTEFNQSKHITLNGLCAMCIYARQLEKQSSWEWPIQKGVFILILLRVWTIGACLIKLADIKRYLFFSPFLSSQASTIKHTRTHYKHKINVKTWHTNVQAKWNKLEDKYDIDFCYSCILLT